MRQGQAGQGGPLGEGGGDEGGAAGRGRALGTPQALGRDHAHCILSGLLYFRAISIETTTPALPFHFQGTQMRARREQ